MTDKELITLLEQTEKAGGALKLTNGPVKMARPKPQHEMGQHAHQWTRLSQGITHPFTKDQINRTDIFAVVEASHTQFKGALRFAVGALDEHFLHIRKLPMRSHSHASDHACA
jgi:hypothetical protein